MMRIDHSSSRKSGRNETRNSGGRPSELTSETVQAGQTIINIVNQVAAPAPVYVSWMWGGCPNCSCPRHRPAVLALVVLVVVKKHGGASW